MSMKIRLFPKICRGDDGSSDSHRAPITEENRSADVTPAHKEKAHLANLPRLGIIV